MIDSVLKEAFLCEGDMVRHRRFLHENAEVGFDVFKTAEYVENELLSLGLCPMRVGGFGIAAVIEGNGNNFSLINNKDGKESKNVTAKEKFSKKICVLLRADMDALPIEEKTGLSFASKNGKMHACGHDMHTAMLLGAAKILVKLRGEFSGKIKLLFQPAEEILSGARDSIEGGILENPHVDYAVALHSLTGVSFDTGSAILPVCGVSAPGADFFKITVEGKSGHGASPESGISTAIATAQIVTLLSTVVSQEIYHEPTDALTVGKIICGRGANVSPDKSEIYGTLRSLSDEKREFLRKRIEEISNSVSLAQKCRSTIDFTSSCPSLINDKEVVKCAEECLKSLYNSKENSLKSSLIFASNFPSPFSQASEDFSYISRVVPSVLIGISAGKISDGFLCGLHSPKTDFDERALPYGASIYASLALKLLKN